MKPLTHRMLLTESSTSDGATLYLVIMPLSAEATVDDILIEVRNELHLFHVILGTVDKNELAQMHLFVNKNSALKLAQSRVTSSSDLTL